MALFSSSTVRPITGLSVSKWCGRGVLLPEYINTALSNVHLGWQAPRLIKICLYSPDGNLTTQPAYLLISQVFFSAFIVELRSGFLVQIFFLFFIFLQLSPLDIGQVDSGKPVFMTAEPTAMPLGRVVKYNSNKTVCLSLSSLHPSYPVSPPSTPPSSLI